jgi:hypothetical protein
MSDYCTYFDSGFLIQGLAMWRSLVLHDRAAVLWVLALDEATARALSALGDDRLRVVTLSELEAADAALAAVKPTRSRAEYFFTLSPCWPRWLLAAHPEIDRLTYLDADLLFFADPAPVFAAMDEAGADVLMTSHRFPAWLRRYERHGRFNVGIQCYRRSPAALAVLDDWRARCLEWCFDRLEKNRYADQKYLDAWPERFGDSVFVLPHPGVNLAPWNWAAHQIELGDDGHATCDGRTLIVFHFARLRPIAGTWWWQSGHLDYGVMPWPARQAIYGAYWRALCEARSELFAHGFVADFRRRPLRFDRSFWRALPLRLLFGSDWLRVGDCFVSGRLGLGRYSGRALELLRTIFLRR